MNKAEILGKVIKCIIMIALFYGTYCETGIWTTMLFLSFWVSIEWNYWITAKGFSH